MLLFAVAAHADDVVLAAQAKLKKQGFYEGGVDGQWGSQTAAAVRRYQLAKDLKVNGELTPETRKSLGISNSGKPAATPVPKYVAIADIFKGGPYISVGPEMQIATIRKAQKSLKLLGYYSGPVDGNPSPALQEAIKAWQKSARFHQSGRFDEDTLKGLDLMPG